MGRLSITSRLCRRMSTGSRDPKYFPVPGGCPTRRRPAGGKGAYVTTTTGKQDAVVVIDTTHKSITATVDVSHSNLSLAETQNIAVGRLTWIRTHHRPRPGPGKPVQPDA
ncbi:hypothetical protein [Nonomuraea sp. NPDC049695]|uniref:hypothetical protein n=1 Tax=Nonomuraea sp. NPDC049695 TaxID=3154734 RepID=UPI00342D37D2